MGKTARREKQKGSDENFLRDISTDISNLFSSNHVAFPRLAAKPIRSFPLLTNSLVQLLLGSEVTEVLGSQLQETDEFEFRL